MNLKKGHFFINDWYPGGRNFCTGFTDCLLWKCIVCRLQYLDILLIQDTAQLSATNYWSVWRNFSLWMKCNHANNLLCWWCIYSNKPVTIIIATNMNNVVLDKTWLLYADKLPGISAPFSCRCHRYWTVMKLAPTVWLLLLDQMK